MQVDWTINLANIIVIVLAVGGLIATWAVLRYQVATNTAAIVQEARDRAAADDRMAGTVAAAVAQAALVREELAAHKLHVAETYVSKAGLREVRDEIMTAVRDLKGSVSTLHERMDQIVLAEGNKRRS